MTLVALAELGRGLVPPDTPLVFADDEGLLRGRAVFETLRVYGGRPFKLAEHLDRLTASAARLHLEPPPHDAFAAAAVEAIGAGGQADAVLRFLWTAGREGGRSPVGLVLVSTLPPDLEERRARGLRLVITNWSAGALAGAKSTSYAENVTAQDDATCAGADDALFVAPDGIVLEAPTANVWFREGDVLHTPSLELPILAGVTRAVLRRGRDVEEGRYPLERLLAADEVFLTSSVREVMPVVRVGGRTFGRGPAAAELQDSLRRYAGAG